MPPNDFGLLSVLDVCVFIQPGTAAGCLFTDQDKLLKPHCKTSWWSGCWLAKKKLSIYSTASNSSKPPVIGRRSRAKRLPGQKKLFAMQNNFQWAHLHCKPSSKSCSKQIVMLTQIICLITLLLKTGARERSYQSLAVAVHIPKLNGSYYASAPSRMPACGHYACFIWNKQQKRKTFVRLSVLFNDYTKPMNEIRELKFGCGRAYFIA